MSSGMVNFFLGKDELKPDPNRPIVEYYAKVALMEPKDAHRRLRFSRLQPTPDKYGLSVERENELFREGLRKDIAAEKGCHLTNLMSSYGFGEMAGDSFSIPRLVTDQEFRYDPVWALKKELPGAWGVELFRSTGDPKLGPQGLTFQAVKRDIERQVNAFLAKPEALGMDLATISVACDPVAAQRANPEEADRFFRAIVILVWEKRDNPLPAGTTRTFSFERFTGNFSKPPIEQVKGIEEKINRKLSADRGKIVGFSCSPKAHALIDDMGGEAAAEREGGAKFPVFYLATVRENGPASENPGYKIRILPSIPTPLDKESKAYGGFGGSDVHFAWMSELPNGALRENGDKVVQSFQNWPFWGLNWKVGDYVTGAAVTTILFRGTFSDEIVPVLAERCQFMPWVVIARNVSDVSRYPIPQESVLFGKPVDDLAVAGRYRLLQTENPDKGIVRSSVCAEWTAVDGEKTGWRSIGMTLMADLI